MEFSQVPAIKAVQCPQCREPLVEGAKGNDGYEGCPKCRSAVRVWRFPALSRSSEALAGSGGVALPGEATCFFHPEKKAAIGCERCGRFVCALCDLPVGNRHLCPACIGSGLGSEKVPELVNHRLVWANLSFSLGLIPLLLFFIIWPIYVLTGPTAIFTGLWGWKKPGSVVQGRRRWISVLGIIGGALQLAILALFGYAVWSVRSV